jgi:PAS domain S-box-containing protein
MRSGTKGKSFHNNYIHNNFLFPIFSVISTFILTMQPAFAQAAFTKAEAASIDAFSGADNLLPSMPGVLIAGLALIFAIRSLGTAKEFKSKLEDVVFVQRKAEKEVAHYRAMFDHSNVGLWQVDLRGITIYANPTMRELLGIESIDEIKDIPDRKFLDIGNAPRRNSSPSYKTILVDRQGNRHEVYVFEQTVVHDADAMSIKVRTVVDVNRLIPKQNELNNNGQQLSKNSTEHPTDKFTAAA